MWLEIFHKLKTNGKLYNVFILKNLQARRKFLNNICTLQNILNYDTFFKLQKLENAENKVNISLKSFLLTNLFPFRYQISFLRWELPISIFSSKLWT